MAMLSIREITLNSFRVDGLKYIMKRESSLSAPFMDEPPVSYNALYARRTGAGGVPA